MPFGTISTISSPASPAVITPPGSLVNDDIMLLWAIADDQNIVSYTPPTGFAAFTGFPMTLNNSGGTDGGSMWAGYKKAASESGNYTISNNVGAPMNGGIGRWTGRDPSAFLHRQSIGSNNTANNSPWSMTTAAFGTPTSVLCDLIFIGWSDNKTSGTVVHTAPSGLTTRVDLSDGTFYNSFLASQDAVSSGATGALTGVGTQATRQSGWGCVCIALAATAGAAAGPPTLPGFYRPRFIPPRIRRF